MRNVWASRIGHNCESLKLTEAAIINPHYYCYQYAITNPHYYCYQYAITELCGSISVNIKHKIIIKLIADWGRVHHHHHVQEGLGLIPVPCILKMKLVPLSLPRSSYVSSSFWFIL
jgi:hypothetical protein